MTGKISDLSAGTTPTGAEKFEALQSGSNVAITPEQLGQVLVHPGYVAGRWYSPRLDVGGGAALGANLVKFIPFMVARRITVSDLGVRISTLSASGHIRLGIYAADASTKYPTGTALNSCVVATDAVGAISSTLGANVSLNSGLYWLAAQADNGTVKTDCVWTSSSSNGIGTLMGDTSLANVSSAAVTIMCAYSASGTYASGLPDATSATFTPISTAANSLIFFKVASVP